MFTDLYDKTIVMSPKEYMDFYQKSKENIEKVEFIYPEIGKRNFGKFKVRLKNHLSEYGRKLSQKRHAIN